MKKIFLLVLFLSVFFAGSLFAMTSDDLLAKVKKAESNFNDFSASISVSGDKDNLEDFGDRFEDVLSLKNGTVKYKKHNMIRVEGKLQGIKVLLIQNGYMRKMQGGIYNTKKDRKNDPGKRQNSLDIGMVSSSLWVDNKVTILDSNDGILKVDFNPIYGGNEKRHELAWIDSQTLKIIKRQRFNYAGELRNSLEYKEYKEVVPGYYIATKWATYNEKKKYLGTTTYTKIKINQNLSNSLFKI